MLEVGDLCTTSRSLYARGTLYRIVNIEVRGNAKMLQLSPVFSIFSDLTKRAKIWENVVDCTQFTIVELGTLYVKLGQFIVNEARRGGMNEQDDASA